MNLIVSFSRYSVVGVINNAIGYLLYLLLTYMGMGHKTAMSLLYALGIVISFHFNRNWTFKHDDITRGVFTRYVATYVLGYFINLSLLLTGVDLLGFSHQAVQAAAIIMVALILFYMHKNWVFAPGLAKSSP